METLKEKEYQKIRLFQDEITSKINSIKTGTIGNDFARIDNAFGMFVSYLDYLPNPDPVLRKANIAITEYANMLSDPYVKGVFGSRKAGVMSKEWELDRGKAKSRQTKIITKMFEDLNIYEVMNNMLDATFYGYQPFEFRFEKLENLLNLKEIVAKPQEWFVFNHAGEMLFLSQEAPQGVPLPNNKFICVKHEANYINPYGTPLAASMYWSAIFKKGGLTFWTKFTEKYGSPWLMGSYNAQAENSTTNAEKLINDLNNMVQDAVILAPENYKVEMTTPQTQSSDIYDKFIAYCKSEIAVALLGHTGSSQSTPGKLGNDTSAIEVRADIIASDKRLIETSMNKIIKIIYDLNFGVTNDYPKFVLYEEEDVDMNLANRDKILFDTGVKFTKDYYQKAYGFVETDFDISEAMPEVKDEVIDENIDEEIDTEKPKFSKHKHFEELTNDQKIIDNEADGFVKLSKKEMDNYLKPVIDFINKKADFSSAINNIASVYPELDSSKLEREIANRLFAADVIGRLSVNSEIE